MSREIDYETKLRNAKKREELLLEGLLLMLKEQSAAKRKKLFKEIVERVAKIMTKEQPPTNQLNDGE